MSEKQQKAVFVREVKKPVQLGKRGIPSPREGEVLIKGLFIGEKLPYILGSNVAGVIDKLGPNAPSSLRVGDRVFGMSNLAIPEPDQAGLQEYAILQTDSLARTPVSFTNDQVVTLPINLATDFIALFTPMGFNFPAPWERSGFDPSSESIVVIGAGSNVAKLFIQLAKLVGIGRIIAITGASNTEELKQMGATHIVDRHESPASIKEKVHGFAGGANNVTHVYDCASWDYDLATSLLSSDKESQLRTLHLVDTAKVKEKRPLCSADFVRCSSANLAPHAAGFWERFPEWLKNGNVKPTPFKMVDGLEKVTEINEALDQYSAGKGGTQLVVHP